MERIEAIAGRVADVILTRRTSAPRSGALLAAISGIDASGKGTVARRAVERLRAAGATVALIPPTRSSTREPR